MKNLTVRLTDDDLLIHWNDLDGIVSHYIVTVYQGVAVLIQSSVTQEFLIISLERYEMLQINVSAANDAGVGQPAVTFFEQSNQSGKENSRKKPLLVHILSDSILFTDCGVSAPKYTICFTILNLHSSCNTETCVDFKVRTFLFHRRQWEAIACGWGNSCCCHCTCHSCGGNIYCGSEDEKKKLLSVTHTS